MELQTGGIIVVIIIAILVLISYAIYLIYSENKELKGKVNVINSSLENVQNNFTTFSNAVTNEFQKSQIEKAESEADSEEESDEESEEDSDIEEQEQMILKSLGLNNSIDLFNHSSEELEDLKKFQNTIQGTKIEEVKETETDEESDSEENTKDQENSKLSITINGDNIANCSKKLTRGKNVGKICERKVVSDSEFCSLHQN